MNPFCGIESISHHVKQKLIQWKSFNQASILGDGFTRDGMNYKGWTLAEKLMHDAHDFRVHLQ